MTYEVLFAPEAEEDLVELFRYIAGEASPDIARRYTDAIVRVTSFRITHWRQSKLDTSARLKS